MKRFLIIAAVMSMGIALGCSKSADKRALKEFYDQKEIRSELKKTLTEEEFAYLDRTLLNARLQGDSVTLKKQIAELLDAYRKATY